MMNGFNIGDKLWYGNVGVVVLCDVRHETVGSAEIEYYVLSDYMSKSASQIFIPTSNSGLVQNMRPLMTKEEVDAFLASIKDIPSAEYFPQNKQRAEKYKRLVDSGVYRDMISVIKAVRYGGALREREGKKNFIIDENLMNKAIRLMATEIAVVLGISDAEAASILCEKLT